MIYSLDNDVNILSVVLSCLFRHVRLIVKSQRSSHTFFFPERFVVYMEQTLASGDIYLSHDQVIYEHAKSLLTTYILFGVDQNPGFQQISHSLGLEMWEEMSRRKFLRTEDDYLALILNTYESRECLLSKLFFTPEEAMRRMKLFQ